MTRTQEKGAVTPQEADPDLPVSVQESLAEAWVNMACSRVGALNTIVHAQVLLKEVSNFNIYYMNHLLVLLKCSF